MIEYSVIYLVIMFILIAFRESSSLSSKERSINARKLQSRSASRVGVVKEKVDEMIGESIKTTRRQEIEKLIQQAGYNYDFIDFFIVSVIVGALMGLVVGILFKNLFMFLLFAFVGYKLPLAGLRLVKNKRTELLSKQIGAFMEMTTERYKATNNFLAGMESTGEEFKTQEPINTEIQKTIMEVKLGVSTAEALDNMGMRTDNRYLKKYANYFKVDDSLGTMESKTTLLEDAHKQYNEDIILHRALERELSEALSTLHIMMGFIPLVGLFMNKQNPEYGVFMTTTTIGKVVVGLVSLFILFLLWFTSNVLGAPLFEDDDN